MFPWILPLLLIVRLNVLVRQRDGGSFTDVDGYAGFEIAVVLATACALLLLAPLRAAVFRIRTPSAACFCGLYALGVVSAVWSPMPWYSIFRALEQLSQLLIVCVLFQLEPDDLRAEKRMLWVFMFCLFASGITVMRFYGLSLSLEAWHTNTYSACGAMIACYCAAELMAGRSASGRHLWFFGSVALVAVAVGTSAASNVATACGLTFAAIMTRNWKVLGGTAVLALLAAVAGLTKETALGLALGGKNLDSFTTLTGRTHLWEQYLPRFLERPLLGEGYAVSARLSDLYNVNTHNSIVSALMGMGAVGGVILILGLFRLLFESWRGISFRLPFSLGCAAALLAGTINSLSCAYLAEGYSVPTLTFNCLVALVAVSARRSKRADTMSTQPKTAFLHRRRIVSG